MRCPRCEDAELIERDRQAVKVDICQSCRGVWLDRGELEKLMAYAERAAAEEQAYWGERPGAERPGAERPGPERPPAPVDREPSGVYREHDRSHHGHGQHRGYPRKKKHWLDTLGDIFD
jgi:uncharacterized protein